MPHGNLCELCDVISHIETRMLLKAHGPKSPVTKPEGLTSAFGGGQDGRAANIIGVCVATVPKTGISSKPLRHNGFNVGRESLMMRIQRVFLAKDALNTDQRRDMTVFPRESPLIPVFGSNDTQTPYSETKPSEIKINFG